jgi:hypothetical protein
MLTKGIDDRVFMPNNLYKDSFNGMNLSPAI